MNIQEFSDKFAMITSIILAVMLFLALIMYVICYIFENKNKEKFINNCTKKEKALLMEYEAIAKNPFKEIKTHEQKKNTFKIQTTNEQ